MTLPSARKRRGGRHRYCPMQRPPARCVEGLGRNPDNAAISDSSLVARSSRPAAAGIASTDSRRVFTSRLRTCSSSCPLSETPGASRAGTWQCWPPFRFGSQRSASPDRRPIVSLWSRSYRGSPDLAPHASGPPWAGSRCDLALLRAGGLLALGFLALALHAGLLVVLAATCLGEIPLCWIFLLKRRRALSKVSILTRSNFCQSRFTSRGLVSTFVRCSLAVLIGANRPGEAAIDPRRQAGGV